MDRSIALGCILFLSATASHAQTAAARTAAPTPTTAPMPAGAVQAGTLASETLRRDTMLGAVSAAAMHGCRGRDDIRAVTPYISKPMQGAEHARTWSEIWVFQCSGASPQVAIDFKETPDGGADYSIKAR